MRKLLYLFFAALWLVDLPIHAQVTPSPLSNYVVEQMPRVALPTVNLNTPYTQVQTSVSYFDGLGRPLQSVQVRGAGDAATDIVTGAMTYDAYGRPQKAYVPVPGTGNAGQLTLNVQAQGAALYQNDQNPFAETVYEASPLNRPVQQFGPGQVWRNGAGRPQAMRYGVGAGIRRFTFNLVAIFANTPTYYGPNDIATRTLTDEQGNQTIDYTDLQGRVIRHDAVLAPTDTLTTVYLYDKFERLGVVIPPKLYRWFVQNPTQALYFRLGSTFEEQVDTGPDNPVFKETAYVYFYDKRGLLSSKHVPNAGWTDMIYDRQDRPVLSRDQQDKTEGRWRFVTYDAFGREATTGRTSLVLSGLQAIANVQSAFRAMTVTDEERGVALQGYTNRSFPPSVPISETALLTVNYYDTAPANTTLAYQSAGAFGTVWGSTTGQLTGTKVRKLETAAWYDSRIWYDFKGRVLQSQSQHHLRGTDRTDVLYAFNGEVQQTALRHQMVPTNQSAPVSSTIIDQYSYDQLSRPISHSFQVLNSVSASRPLFEMTRMSYDAIGRLGQKQIEPEATFASTVGVPSLTLTTTPNSSSEVQASQRVEVLPSGFNVDYRANPAGILDIALSSNTNTSGTTNALQILDYSYHIRGQLQGVNAFNGRADLNAGQNDVFGFRLDFETAGRFDGNIGRQTWLHNRDLGQPRSYSYAYDRADRLTAATYTGKSGENLSVPYIAYDPNGNILAMNRQNIDQLSYTYSLTGLGNSLLAVSDASSNTLGFADGNTSGNDYEYYPDGSLKKDLNRGITEILYNHLKLPRQVTLSKPYARTITFQYDAAGQKLQTADPAFNYERLDYVGPVRYTNESHAEVYHAEGVLRHTDNRWDAPLYDYFHRDHLGSVRAVYSQTVTAGGANAVVVTQYQDYDPWGLELAGLSGGRFSYLNRQKFNGKEDLGPLSSTPSNASGLTSGLLDFGARLYDAPIGRMHTVDRAAEMFSHVSGYSFGLNNPVYNIDPTGDTTVPAQNMEPFKPERGATLLNEVVIKAKAFETLTNTGQRNGGISGGGGFGGMMMNESGQQVNRDGSPYYHPNDFFSTSLFIQPKEEGSEWVNWADNLLSFASPMKGIMLLSKINPAAKVLAAKKLAETVVKEGIDGARVARKAVTKGQAPKGVDRIDIPTPDRTGSIPHGQQPHAHMGRRALNQDGTWKHGEGSVKTKTMNWLIDHGWQSPKN